MGRVTGNRRHCLPRFGHDPRRGNYDHECALACADRASSLDKAQDAAEAIREALGGFDGSPLIPSQIAIGGGGGGTPNSVTRGAVTVNITAQVDAQQVLDELERRLRAETDARLEQVRAALGVIQARVRAFPSRLAPMESAFSSRYCLGSTCGATQ